MKHQPRADPSTVAPTRGVPDPAADPGTETTSEPRVPPTADGELVRWLSPAERSTWLALVALSSSLPNSVGAQLTRDADLSLFEYSTLAFLSEQPDRTLRMSQLAAMANGSLSRLSHVARRLEAKGYIVRRPLPEDGRTTIAVLTDTGFDAIVAAAPAHVRHVRSILYDILTPDEQAELGRLAWRVLDGLGPTGFEALRAAIATTD
ncbi:MAG: MarR family winged helix-turn-helix transcriptional regulator [Lapillicoccus sp.]